MNNLWKDLDLIQGDNNNPVDLVEEQSVFLREGTEDLFYLDVEAIGRLSSLSTQALKEANVRRDFAYKVLLSSDELPEYSFHVFNIYYGITFFPLVMKLSNEIGDEIVVADSSIECLSSKGNSRMYFKIKSEEEFTTILEIIFNCEKVRTVLKNMKTIIGDDEKEE